MSRKVETINKQRDEFKGVRETRIIEDFPRDDSSLDVKNMRGGKMGGSATNLSHSLTGGASAVQQDKSMDHPL